MNCQKELPEFIKSRMDFLMKDLINTDYGKNLVVGLTPERGDVLIQSNDYLDISEHVEIRGRLIESLQNKKSDMFMSSIFLHDNNNKYMLENELSKYTNFSNSYISQSGWNANVSLLQAICVPDTNVYIDFFAHMSMWEGARYSCAKIRPFMHNNSNHLRKLIQRNGPGIIVVDSIYSTIGTIAPLEEIVSIAQEYGCVTVVDESHSLGVYGENGAGMLSSLGLSEKVDFMTASLAKAFAYRAGLICTNSNFGQCIPYTAFSNIFSSTMMNYEIYGLKATLDVIRSVDDRREALFSLSKRLRLGLREIGLDIRSQSHIISLETGDEYNTKLVRDILEEQGIFGSVFCRPATPKNRNIIRFSMNSSLTNEDVDRIISVCKCLLENENVYFK
ncbi:alpha-hydroxyketone-type quorum-sensing autoinducer synthase [Vibrio mangrovi]|uniref:Alpha-hydroxyketone-type quorum-sensing autoinducer synthase n=1 Tax=Vibrio mangrovi TaxID=474394 RepID=A0ABU4ICT2_9VIBR|nr:alpha-hydroxyketone-type quorum-sensing autoinducer synthase [Vibrio mangrovi]MDW6004778.1 alpha-hydroxyketone-type quorum-sensing autoinducer synthase [Vibrio mangrovi]